MPLFNVGFVIFPHLTQLDFTGPQQVLARLPGSAMHIVAKSTAQVPSDSGLSLVPTHTYLTCPRLDLICVPGGSAGVVQAMADRDTIVPIPTIADGEHRIAAFTEVLIAAIERHRGTPRAPMAAASWTVEPETVVAPREAFFAPHQTVPAAEAIGRVSAELIAPYPPGVPVLAPGELITKAAIEALRGIEADGGRIAYAADPSLATFQVIARQSTGHQ